MIAHVVRRASEARLVSAVWVATDDPRIAAAARAAGALAVMTSPAHRSGTDRVAEAARACTASVVLNVQGDEPALDPANLDRLVHAMQSDPSLGAATLAVPLEDDAEWLRPDVVKVVAAEDGTALLFSRSPIPCDPERPGRCPKGALRHLGLYAFRRDVLERFATSEPTALERLERFEQLRLLERGVRMKVVPGLSDSPAVDRPEDIARVETWMDEHSR